MSSLLKHRQVAAGRNAKKLSDEVVAAMGFSRSYPFTTFHDAVYVHCSDTLPHKPCQVGGLSFATVV